MTPLVVDWTTLSTAEFVGWTKVAGVRLPYPLNTGELPYIDTPDTAAVIKILELRRLTDSAALSAAKAALSGARLAVYAMHVPPAGAEQRFVAVAGEDDAAVLAVVDGERVALREVPSTELAPSLVAALPPIAGATLPEAELTLREMQLVDDAFAQGRPVRTIRELMERAGYPPALAEFRERCGTDRGSPGALGAVAFDRDGGRHSTRGVAWQEYSFGTLLLVEQRRRRGEPSALVGPFRRDALIRAGVDLVAGLYERG